MLNFDEQIRQRREQEQLHLDRAVKELAGSVNREESFGGMHAKNAEDAALYELRRYYRLPEKKLPSDLTELEEKMDCLLESDGIMHRHVSLNGDWWSMMAGPVLCRWKADGTYVALLQDALDHYYYWDKERKCKVSIKRENAEAFESDALCFYRPLPNRTLTARDMLRFAFRCPSALDWAVIFLCTTLVTLAGMVTPKVTEQLFSSVIPAGSELRLMSSAVLLITMAFGVYLLNTFQSIFDARITQKVSFDLSAAAFSRMLSMPADFFKAYSTGEMASRVRAVERLGTMLMEVLLSGGITAIFSLLYLFQITSFAPSMLLPALTAIVLQLIVNLLLVISRRKLQNRLIKADASLSGTVFSLFSGIQKIRLSGAENRAFHRWADSYRTKAGIQFAPPVSLILLLALSPVAALLGSILIYVTGASRLSLSAFMGFQAAYGLTSAAFLNFADIAGQLASIDTTLTFAKPLMENAPELRGDEESVHELRGRIELTNLSFRYNEDGPWIVDGMNLTIEPGSYVAIVGTTGCGKSTLLRVLLGFETPQVGSVFYDGMDIRRLDIRSLRRKIGTVLQDGKLFGASIYQNIVVSSPDKSLDAAWEAAEVAQIADDIRRMPMGMYTNMAGGGISGGQRQRILIARAVAPKPKILIFDEATSALDNETQAKVSEALDGMDCTRIVVAHRLSTIRNCERIIVLDRGRIVQDGTYEELMGQEGLFSDLVSRQRPENKKNP